MRHPSAKSSALRSTSASLALLLAGCALGPDYAPPAGPAGSQYETSALPAATQKAEGRDGEAQRFTTGGDLPGEWWTLFHSSALDQLIRQALANNPDIRAAEASLRQAQELAVAQRGALLPQVDATAGRSRNRVSGASSGLPAFSSLYNLNNASVGVSYDLDLFGGTRRSIEAAEASSDYQRWQRQATILSLTANIVTTALQEASLRAQIKATHEIVDAEAEQLRVVQSQFELGGAAKTDVLAQASLLAQVRATLPGLEKQLEQQRHLLATLAGRTPAEGIEGTFDLDGLALPSDLPVSLPAKLAEQRPDIQAAAANLHVASAEVGVAMAAQWPKLTLSGSYGTAANDVSQMFTSGAAMWSIGASVTQPIFHGGELGHRRAAAEAAFDAAKAQYESVVLNALRNVADSLRALQSDADALAQQVAYFRSASDSLALAKQRYQAGAISHLNLLDAERTEAQARIALVQAQAARLADSAALFQALGGGWWNRPDNAPQPPDLIDHIL